MKIELDVFELFWFIEGCAKGSHLRQGIWKRCVDEFYGMLGEHERANMFDWFTRLLWKDICGDDYPNEKKQPWGENLAKEDFQRTVSCFNPDNRYIITVSDGKKTEIKPAYLFKGTYWVSFNYYAPKELITKIEKV